MASTSTGSPSPVGKFHFLSSPGAQRRLLFVSAAVFAAGLVVFLALVVFPSNSGTTSPTVPTTATKPTKPAKTVPASAAAIAVGRKFIESAVARKNLASSYALVTGDVKGGLTKKQWETGNISVTPYPVGNAATTHFQILWSHPKQVMFELTLVARPGSSVRPDLKFYLGLERAGGKANGRWLVSYWAPYYTLPIRPAP